MLIKCYYIVISWNYDTHTHTHTHTDSHHLTMWLRISHDLHILLQLSFPVSRLWLSFATELCDKLLPGSLRLILWINVIAVLFTLLIANFFLIVPTAWPKAPVCELVCLVFLCWVCVKEKERTFEGEVFFFIEREREREGERERERWRERERERERARELLVTSKFCFCEREEMERGIRAG